ncbi:MAG: tyrosine-type recombinase/integrase [Akkermansiaceae bacterium]|nr:tyrosine-type recombinase/integrase [Akkermansiaceae bacterium]
MPRPSGGATFSATSISAVSRHDPGPPTSAGCASSTRPSRTAIPPHSARTRSSISHLPAPEAPTSDSTVNQAVCALRAFYRDHLGRKWRGWSRIKIRRDEQLPNVLSREEVARFSARSGRTFRAVFTLMYHCGLRLGEAIHLKPGHIDASRGVIRIVGAKGGRDREIPVPRNSSSGCAPSEAPPQS